MALTVEDGTGVAGANSYLALVAFKTYAASQGYALTPYTDPELEAALIRATRWIDAVYGSRFIGTRSLGRGQLLQWPRKAGSVVDGVVVQWGPLLTVTDAEGYAIAVNEIPQELKDALAEAAWREVQEPSSLAPDLDRGGAIRSIEAGSVAITYATTAPVGTVFSKIDGILSTLIGSASVGYTGRAVEA